MRPHFGDILWNMASRQRTRSTEPAPQPLGLLRTGDAYRLIDEVDDESVDLVITSPPYWGIRTYGLPHSESVLEEWRAAGCADERTPPYDWYSRAGGVLGLEPYPNWYIDHLIEFFSKARRTLQPTGSLWVNLGDTYFARWSSIRDDGRQGFEGGRTRRRTPSGGYLHDKQLLLVPARFAVAMQDQGWILRNDLIWAKPNPIPRPERDRLRLSHEHWFHFVQRQSGGRRPTYHYDLDASEQGALDVVVHESPATANGHSATFPAEFVKHRIATSCPDRGLVLDPFSGSGTALVAAVTLGRRALGFEASAKYARSARSRLRKVLEKMDE